MAIVVLRHCYQIDRRTAGALPRWERELLVEFGKRLLNIGVSEPQELPDVGISASEMHVLMTPGAS